MRILLIAYEFPPIIAAQSLRWFYLSDELARRGVEVHVLCPDLPALPDYPVRLHDHVIPHRVWPGPYVGFSQRLASNALKRSALSATVGDTTPSVLLAVYRLIRRGLDQVLYPDLRTEWYPFAKPKLRALLAQYPFDVVISSHEPGVDLLLGWWAKKHFARRWVIDLGDPLLAPYTPVWRRGLDRRFERFVLDRADRIVVTTDSVQDLLCERHHLVDRSRFISIPQGFPTRREPGDQLPPTWPLPADRMNIVFTGTFYRDFRSPERLALALRALAAREAALTIAGDNASFRALFDQIPNVRFTGRIDHFQCLELQRQADLLLNIGNVQAYQLPGKVYEYFGAGKPILHLQTGAPDPGAELIQALGAGLVVENDVARIGESLAKLIEAWRGGGLNTLFFPRRDAIRQHAWESRAAAYHQLLSSLG